MNHQNIATAARALAKDILLSQMAVRIQERLSAAKADLVQSIRAFAVMKRDWAKEDEDAAEAKTKREAKQKAFDEALASVEGLSEEELAAAQEAVAADRKESDDKASEEAEAQAEARTKAEANAQKRVEDARKAVAHHTDNLDKLSKGSLKVNAEELKTLASKLIDEGRVTEVAEISAEE